MGVSLINSVPEELIYGIFRGIKVRMCVCSDAVLPFHTLCCLLSVQVEFVSCKDNQNLIANVQYIQVGTLPQPQMDLSVLGNAMLER